MSNQLDLTTIQDHIERQKLGLIERVVFDTDQFPEAEGLQQFQHLVCAPVLVTSMSQPFRGRVITYWLGPIRFRIMNVTNYRVTRNYAKIASDGIDHFILTYMIDGRLVGDFDGRMSSVSAGGFYCHDFSRPGWVEGALEPPVERYRFMMMGLPRPLALRWISNPAALHGAIIEPDDSPELSRLMTAVIARLDTMTRAESGTVLDAILDLAVPLLKRKQLATAARPSPNFESSLVQQARRYIETNLQSRSLTPELIAKELKVSRSQLYKAYQPLGGISRYIWTRRLSCIHAALMSGADSRSISLLAYDYGFTSPIHMSRMFKDVYGSPPRALRK